MVERGGRFLLARRPLRGRLGGMWEFPGGMMGEDETGAAALPRVLRNALGIEVAAVESLPSIEHVFTHVRVTYHPVAAKLMAGEPHPAEYDEVRWLAPRQFAEVALPRAQQRIAGMVRADG